LAGLLLAVPLAFDGRVMHEFGHFSDHAIETNVQPVNAESNARNATPHPLGRRARFKTSATATATSGTTVRQP